MNILINPEQYMAISQLAYNGSFDTIFSQNGDDLNITVAGSSDTISVQSWFLSTDNQIETIESADGSVITNSQIELLIQAMATYSSNNNGISWIDAIGTSPNDVQSILAQYWTTPTS